MSKYSKIGFILLVGLLIYLGIVFPLFVLAQKHREIKKVCVPKWERTEITKMKFDTIKKRLIYIEIKRVGNCKCDTIVMQNNFQLNRTKK